MTETKFNGCIVEQCKIRTECNFSYGCENPPCAKAVVENCHSLQQLQDAIAVLAVELEHAVYPNFSHFETRSVITKMLLLSGRDKYNTATASI